VTKIVVPWVRRSSRMCCHRFSRLCGSRPVDGSSRKSSSGECSSPRAMSRRRFWPPLSAEHAPLGEGCEVERFEEFIGALARFHPAHSVEGALAEHLVTHALVVARAVALADVADAAAHLVLVHDADVVAGDRSPCRRWEASSVVSIRTLVDLPAPFGPRKATSSPRFTSRSRSVTASTSSRLTVNCLG
jgi:hypothetical protein